MIFSSANPPLLNHNPIKYLVPSQNPTKTIGIIAAMHTQSGVLTMKVVLFYST